MATLGAAGCRGLTSAAPDPEPVVAAVDAGADAASYDPAHPPVPLTGVETGGGRIELVGLWREGPFVRAAIAAQTLEDGFMLSGRFGPLLREMSGMLLVDPAARLAYPVLTPPGAAGVTGCLCSPSLVAASRGALYHADFRVPESVGEVLVLGDATPPFGRVRIASAAPDLTGGGYSWLGDPPPPLGARPYNESRAQASLPDPAWPSNRSGAGASVSAELRFPAGIAVLPDDAGDDIAELAGRLHDLPAGTTITVVGHTDSRGTEAANLRLSQRRAQVVADALAAELGRDDLSIVAEGRGRAELVVPDVDDDGEPIPENRARNRRVEILVARPSPTSTGLPADASRAAPADDEVATVEVVPDPAAGDRIRIGVQRVVHDPDLGLTRLDLRLALVDPSTKVRRSLLGDDALAEPTSRFGNGARDLRLVDLTTGAMAAPVTDALDQCLCPDEIDHTLLAGTEDRISVWFPDAPPGTTSVGVLIPRAGLLRDVPVT